MPTGAYAKLLISVNGGSPTTGGVTVGPFDTVQLSGEMPALWDHGQFEIYDWPDGWTGPIGWTLATSDEGDKWIFYSTGGALPPEIVAPPNDVYFGKWLLRLVVNDGVRNGRADPTLVDETTAFETLSMQGLHGIAAREEGQFDSLRFWAGQLQKTLAKIDALLRFGPQQTLKITDGLSHAAGTGVDIAAATTTGQTKTTPVDAEIVADDGAGNWASWRLTRIFRRTAGGSAVAASAVKVSPGYPDGSNSGTPPSGWTATIELGTGSSANTAFVKLTGNTSWFWVINGSRYPGDELAFALTVDGVWPPSGPTAGGTSPPTIVSITPSFGSTAGG